MDSSNFEPGDPLFSYQVGPLGLDNPLGLIYGLADESWDDSCYTPLEAPAAILMDTFEKLLYRGNPDYFGLGSVRVLLENDLEAISRSQRTFRQLSTSIESLEKLSESVILALRRAGEWTKYRQLPNGLMADYLTLVLEELRRNFQLVTEVTRLVDKHENALSDLIGSIRVLNARDREDLLADIYVLRNQLYTEADSSEILMSYLRKAEEIQNTLFQMSPERGFQHPDRSNDYLQQARELADRIFLWGVQE